MGIFDFLKRRREREAAIPDKDSAGFEQAVAATELPGSTGAAGVESGQWQQVNVGDQQTVDLRGSGAREEMLEALRRHGIDPEAEGQQIDAGSVPGLQKEILEILEKRGVDLDGPGN